MLLFHTLIDRQRLAIKMENNNDVPTMETSGEQVAPEATVEGEGTDDQALYATVNKNKQLEVSEQAGVQESALSGGGGSNDGAGKADVDEKKPDDSEDRKEDDDGNKDETKPVLAEDETQRNEAAQDEVDDINPYEEIAVVTNTNDGDTGKESEVRNTDQELSGRCW